MNANIKINADVSGAVNGLKNVSDATNSVTTSIGKFDKAAGSLRGQMKKAKTEAQNLAYQLSQLSAPELNSDFGQKLQQQFEAAKARAAELQDQFADVNQEIKNMSSDTRSWDAVKEGVGVLSSGLSGLASVYGLLGGNTEKFAQALVTVNAVQSIANTIVGIGNALQKQSALMQGLRAAANKILGVSITTTTAAEVANTAALGAETAATGAATTATWSFNAALAANPIGAVVVAVAALAAGIYALVQYLGEATPSEQALTAATEALETAMGDTMKNAGEQIATFNSLKKTYDECGGNVDVLKKKFIDNTEAQRKLGVSLKTVDDVHKLFGKNSKNYIAYCNARATALAAEAAQAAILGQVLTELSTVQTKLMRGEEVDFVDFTKILKKAGLSDEKINSLVKEAGGDIEWDYIWSNLDDSKMDWGKFMSGAVDAIVNEGAGKVLQQLQDTFQDTADAVSADWDELLEKNDKGANSSKKQTAAAKKTHEEIKKILTSLEGCDAIISEAENEMKKLDSSAADYAEKMQIVKNTILTAKAAKLQLLDKTTIAGLTESRSLIQQIINELPQGAPALESWQKELQKVDEQLLNIYQDMAKNGSANDLKKVKSAIEQIMSDLPQGHPLIRMYAELWKQVNSQIEKGDRLIKGMQEGIQEGSIAFLKREISRLEAEQNKLNPVDPDAAKKIEELERQIAALNSQLRDAEAKEYRIKFNVTGDTETHIKNLQNMITLLENKSKLFTDIIPKQDRLDDISAQLKLLDHNIAYTEKLLYNFYNSDFGKEAKATNQIPDYIKELEAKLDESKKKATELRKQKIDIFVGGGRGIDYINQKMDALKANIAHTETMLAMPGLDDLTMKSLNEQLVKFHAELSSLALEKYQVTIQTNIAQVKDEIKSLSWDAFEGGVSGFKSMYDAIDGLGDKLDDAKNGFEALFAVFDTIFTIVDNVMAMIESVEQIIELVDTLSSMNTAAKEMSLAHTEATRADTQATIENATAKSTQATAEGLAAEAATAGAAAEGAAIPALELSRTAKSQLAIAALDLATANIAAAHSEIPFAGPALAAAGIAAVTAAVTSAHGAMLALQAFAEGGIVKGSTTTGDRVLARLNSGEMVLNSRQQTHLFNMLDNGGVMGSANSELTGTVKVRGADLEIALTNYNKTRKTNRNL